MTVLVAVAGMSGPATAAVTGPAPALIAHASTQATAVPGTAEVGHAVPRAIAAAPGGEVVAIQPRDNGEVEYSYYRTARGVSVEELHAKLAAAGVKGLQEPHAAVGATACTYSTARAFDNGACPPARWRWNGYSDPQVYFRDLTPAAWPVWESVQDWNRSYGVDSYWTSGSCPGSGRHCVSVSSRNYGANGWGGLTVYRVDGGRWFVDGSVVTYLNDYYAASSADRRNSTCHEMGHALGVGHNLSSASCVYSPDTGSNPQYPHSTDYSLLRYVIYP